jgi:ABC-type transport system substrate-binding protein
MNIYPISKDGETWTVKIVNRAEWHNGEFGNVTVIESGLAMDEATELSIRLTTNTGA